jgi:uncharacterized YigZ family protein
VGTYPFTIAGAVEHELVERKSRFLARAVPVSTVAEADAVIAAVRKEHWDARHHCVALVVGTHADQQRSSDDGEPSGTAGIPMLEVLRRRALTDLVVVVTRYFGGVKLGAGGLVRAYSSATSEVLDRATLVRRVPATEVTVTVPHTEVGRLHGVLAAWAEGQDARVRDVDYGGEQAVLGLLVPPTALTALDSVIASASAGTLCGVRGETVLLDLI